MKKESPDVEEDHASATSDVQSCLFAKSTCYFCGKANHARNACLVKALACNYCSKVGHYAKACRKKLMKLCTNRNYTSNAISRATLAPISASAVRNLNNVSFDVKLRNAKAKSLMVAVFSSCYFNKKFAPKHTLKIFDRKGKVTLAETLTKCKFMHNALLSQTL